LALQAQRKTGRKAKYQQRYFAGGEKMPGTRSDLQKLLDRDSLHKVLDEMLEVNPATVVLGYYSDETKQTMSYWFGVWPMALGLSDMLYESIKGWDGDESEEA